MFSIRSAAAEVHSLPVNRIARTIELDEKFCDVIIKRYIGQVGTLDGVSVTRAGVTLKYLEVAADEG